MAMMHPWVTATHVLVYRQSLTGAGLLRGNPAWRFRRCRRRTGRCHLGVGGDRDGEGGWGSGERTGGDFLGRAVLGALGEALVVDEGAVAALGVAEVEGPVLVPQQGVVPRQHLRSSAPIRPPSHDGPKRGGRPTLQSKMQLSSWGLRRATERPTLICPSSPRGT